MIRLEIPGWGACELEHLVLDLNGTVALDGQVLPGVDDKAAVLSAHLALHLVTADTHGRAEETNQLLGGHLVRIKPRHEARQKQELVERLGAGQVVAVGNGANDARMLTAAGLGIAILGREGLAAETLRAADLVVGRIEDAFDLLLHPRRLVATLRR